MKIRKSKIVFIIVLVFTVLSLSACTKTDNGNETTNNGNETTKSSNDESTLIVTVGNKEMHFKDIIGQVNYVRNQYEGVYGTTIWEMDLGGYTFEDMAKEWIINDVVSLYIVGEKANELGITLTDEDKAEIEENAASYMTGVTENGGNTDGVDEDIMKELFTKIYLANKVFEDQTKDVDTQVSDEEARHVTIQHLLIRTNEEDENGELVDFPEDKQKEILAKAKTLLKEAKTVEDFKAFAEENTADGGVEYTFGKGEMDTAFEESAFSLKTGEMSGLVKSVYGYHILYCVSDFAEDETAGAKEEIIQQRQSDAFNEIYSAWLDQYPYVVNEAVWSTIKLTTEEATEEDATEETSEETSAE